MNTERVNIAQRLSEMAAERPNQPCIVMPTGKKNGKYSYRSMTFAELDDDSNRLAAGLQRRGLKPGQRMALLVPPSIDFVSWTFALFKAGAVTILIDPGMGKENLIHCLSDAKPEGFVTVRKGHIARMLYRSRFPEAMRSKLNVAVGGWMPWSGPTDASFRSRPTDDFQPADTTATDPAAIIFTTGSTGPPKGVLYRHGNFDNQVTQIRDRYNIEPGGVDLAGFPLFGLFNSAMGMTTVIPDMDASRPASVDPEAILRAAEDWKATQSFASPAVWNVVGRYCEENNRKLPTLKRVLSAGAPVPPAVLNRMRTVIADDGEIYTPYGATESLPVASISASEVLDETAARTASGGGTCVGRRYSGIEWRVIRITDGPMTSIDDALDMPRGEIGELIVSGAVVTTEYVTRTDANATAKIPDGDSIWHRMGDLGYFDDQDRFWFCGRKSHRVVTAAGPMYPVRCEAIANEHPSVFRSALVGVGAADAQTPVMICELLVDHVGRQANQSEIVKREIHQLLAANALTDSIRAEHVLLHDSLPVDIRHNAKIFREKLGPWAALQLEK